MILRSKKIPFMASGSDTKFVRMTNFTEFSVSKNPSEHTSKYIDEDFERSEIVSYATSASYKFELENDNEVHTILMDIADNEKCGDEAKVTIAIVDFSSTADSAKKIYPCRVREFTVVPSSEGDASDVYTYSGTLKAIGVAEEGWMKMTDDGNGTYSVSKPA